MKDKIVAHIYETTDYDKFKRLEGNRTVLNLRVKKIIDSIKKIGLVRAPIIVNENYEVIDGQGRLEASKRLAMPVYYTVVEGIGIDECIAMNVNQTNWRLIDYIESYAEKGNVSYMYLSTLIKAFSGKIQDKAIFCIATGKFENPSRTIKEGRVSCTASDYTRAQNVLSWLVHFAPIFKRVKGHSEYYYNALAFCYEDADVDNERLLQKINQLQANLIPVTNMLQAFDVIEEIYNHHSKKRVYIKTNYRKALDNKYPWYGNKWGKIHEE